MTLTLTGFQAHRARPLFSPIDAVIPAGSFVAVVGPNGAGKSSLLGALAGTGVASSGRAELDGVDLGTVRARNRAGLLGLMTQDGTAPNELLVHDIVAIGSGAAQRAGIPHPSVSDALALVGAAEHEWHRASALSGGQRQLVQLARLLAQAPPLMLLDEPTSALDPAFQLRALEVIRDRCRAGHTALVTLHDLGTALRFADRVLVIPGSGQAALTGGTEDVLTPELIERVYGVSAELVRSSSGLPLLALGAERAAAPVRPKETAR
ncbi:ABC transporter ATP-binding protein [Leucobacter sp. M11]|uniref:ABC transporter ATP-binding protein n=1 Tax=Leucobacter sp. M11 TaxID=2993565 RepID=UPI002D805C0A|nr:ABC transporter ATP-binding protein [Leucobacter sp. M11]MEB4615072.1 ABC transporter ATP-binding protein [Leucobacter sp. M11]